VEIGKLEYYNEPKGFGIIVKRQDVEGGYKLVRFYLAKHRISFVGVDKIAANQWVRFTIGPTPTNIQSGGKPLALDAEIFESELLAQLVDEKATPVVQESNHE
jgi:cold shock CspA family protein